ncbi:WD40 repeat domain-containing protein [Streptomyces sp. NBC_01456]|uniref:nSTAND1 domain-containing NTPase n=1 Tax=unclassified Streptomyces TaxID=2593676 RepID=UPI002E314FDE|nr:MULTISPECIES: helix-turn-helix domain-containing protein [unclassified Streptomyces]
MEDDGSALTDFAAGLRLMRDKAGKPTYRQLATKAHYSSTTLADAAGGRKLPSLEVALAFVRACGGDEEEWKGRWHEVAAGLAPASPNGRDRAGPEQDRPCPYVGLAAFQPEDASWFFGREKLTDDVVTRVRADRFVAVFGASGSGKSSLLRAGLVPRMSGGDPDGDQGWPALLFTPGAHPLEECAARLAAFAGGTAPELHGELSGDPRALHQAVLQALATGDRPDGTDLLLVVDQFEEVFTLCRSKDERDRFISALLTAAQAANSRTRVVIGVRADFYASCSEHPELVAALQDAQLLVGPMSTEELRRAVSRPAVRRECAVETALLARVVAEATGQANVLPLVSHAMRETWLRRRGNTLTLSGYEAAGGIPHALANTAEALYQQLTAEQQRLTRSVLLRMVAPGEGTDDTKRPVPRADLGPDTGAVLDLLARARLVTLDRDGAEITHEALLHAWPRLRRWIDEDRAGLLMHQQITEAAAVWQRQGRDPGALYRGGVLAAARQWAATRGDALVSGPRIEEFLAASVRHAGRAARLRRAGIAAVCVLALVASVAAVVAFKKSATAHAERNNAIAGEVQAEAGQLRETDPSLAAQLDIAAYRIHPQPKLRTDLINAAGAPVSRPLAAGSGTVYAVAYSPDRRTLAAAGADGMIRLWNVADPAAPVPLGRPVASHSQWVYWLAFSPDGRTLASAGRDRTVRLWNVTRPAHPAPWGQPLTGHTSYVFSVSFSRDGRTLASASDDGTVRLWNVADPAHPQRLGQPLKGHDHGAVASAAFSPDGRTLASAGHDHTIRLWDVTHPAGPRRLGRLTGFKDTVYAVAFSPDSRLLAGVGNDRTVRLWNVADPADPVPLGAPLTAHHDTVYAVAFSPDGRVMATAGADHTVRLWNVMNPSAPVPIGQPLTGHTEYVYWLAFSPDGHSLASAGADHTVRLWHLPSTLLPDRSYVNTVAFSPVRHILASGSTDHTIRLWNVADPSRPTPLGRPLTGHHNAVRKLAFSPDGKLLASAGRDGTIRLWDVRNPTRAALVGHPLTGHQGEVNSVSFSPDARTLASAGLHDGQVRLWDVSRPANATGLGEPLTVHNGPVTAVAFSPRGHVLATASADDTTRLWDVTRPARPIPLGHPLAARSGGVYGVAFSPDGRTLATANVDHTVRLWNVTDPDHPSQLGTALVGHTGPIDDVAFSPDGHSLASASDDRTVRLWTLDPDRAIRRLCAATGGVTAQQWRRYVPELALNQPCS